VVDDLGDNGDVTSGRSVVNKDDSADFDESLEGGWLLGLDVSCVYGYGFIDRAVGQSSCSFSILSLELDHLFKLLMIFVLLIVPVDVILVPSSIPSSLHDIISLSSSYPVLFPFSIPVPCLSKYPAALP
jgi:hypothetical protein